MESLVQLYETKFDPEEYLQEYYVAPDPEVTFFMQNLHDSLKELKPSNQSILEIGCGPTFTSVLSATGWSSEVYMTDFLEKNLSTLKSYLSSTEKMQRWKPYAEVVAELELCGSDNVIERLAKNVKHVGKCDVFSLSPALGIDVQFDLVISTLCLEFVAITQEAFILALKNIRRILKIGGILILQGALNNTYYDMRDQRFPSLQLDEAKLRECLSKSGFHVHKFRSIERICSEEEKKADHDGCFFIWAESASNV